jgi:hypothetical protein
MTGWQQLWEDLKVDGRYVKRGRKDRNGQALTVERAKVLNAALNLRLFLLLGAMFSLTQVDVDQDSGWFWGWPFLLIKLLPAGALVLVASIDFDRQWDVTKISDGKMFARPNHFEVAAILFAIFCFCFQSFVLGPFERQALALNATIVEVITPIMWFVGEAPWVGLLYLMLALGAYQRWKEAVGQSASPNAPQIAT